MHDPSENPPPHTSTSANRADSQPTTADGLVNTGGTAPSVAQPIVAQSAVAPSVVQPPIAPPSVAQPSVAQPTLAQPAVAQPTVAPPTVPSDDSLILFKGLKRLHEEEQTMPIRDSDGNTRPFPVADPNAIRRGPRPLPQLPQGEVASVAGGRAGVPSQAIDPPQLASTLSQRPSVPRSPQGPIPTGSRATKQFPARRATSPPTDARGQVNPAPTPLYSSVSPFVDVCLNASENVYQLVERPFKRFKDLVRSRMHARSQVLTDRAAAVAVVGPVTCHRQRTSGGQFLYLMLDFF